MPKELLFNLHSANSYYVQINIDTHPYSTTASPLVYSRMVFIAEKATQ